MSAKYKVLLVGSGMMTPTLVDYLTSFKDTHITVASNLVEDARSVAARAPSFADAVYLDVFDATAVEALVGKHDLVISFIPPTLHMHVLRACVKVGVNVTTSSYISPDMLALHEEAKAKGLVILNECGLDPGIDIMGTMKVVHEAQERGWKVVSYESYCGGLPVAEQADNPLGYKFSWNPGAAIKASRNTAIFRKNGHRVVASEPLKCVVDDDDASMAMKLESYPNRDSTVFLDRFGMADCRTFIRGTYRFQGFSSVISAFHDVGLTSDDLVADGVQTLRDLCRQRFEKVAAWTLTAGKRELCARLTDGLPEADRRLVEGLLSRVDTGYLRGDPVRIESAFRSIVKTMRFLGFFSDAELKVEDGKGKRRSCLDAFCDVMAEKMAHSEVDRDLVVMRHVFIMEDQHGKQWRHTSTMMQAGQSHASGGSSIMSQTVGVTAAIGARLVLEGKVPQRGVLSPVYKELYQPILKELQRFGVLMVEESERPGGAAGSNRPKL